MLKKVCAARLVIVVTALSAMLHAAAFLPIAFADTPSISEEGTIQIVTKEESEMPGYFHQKYVFWHPGCAEGNPVDYYGPEINPTDENIIQRELKACRERPDGSGSDGSE